MKLDKDAIKASLTEDDIHKILLDLGSEKAKEDKEKNPIFTTVCHNSKGGSHKLYYYKEGKLFHCYTTCGESMDIYELVIRSHSQRGVEISFHKAIQYVANITGKFITSNILLKESHIVDDWNWLNRFKRKEKVELNSPTINENILDVFIKKPHELWLNEITYETQMKFEVCYYFRENRIITPHRNIDSELIGLTGRALNQESIDIGQKYMPISVENKIYSFPTIYNLYGLHKTKHAIKRLKKAAIFESQKSVMKCEDFYGKNNFSVATCSSNISNYHRDLILELGVEEVFICFDKFRGKKENETDEKYSSRLIDYQENILKLAKKFSSFTRVYILWDFKGLLEDKDAPVDKGQQILELLMKDKFEVTTKDEVIT
ncbi:hypothetical protein KDN24_06930 [Bacillus sp. Bva_UNVM-123]|uniref:hypothetical protein n=1 Tax=Bacillus sp. Bva_UNVM-123 TaxID=2829798 RepID=UPI00391F23FA